MKGVFFSRDADDNRDRNHMVCSASFVCDRLFAYSAESHFLDNMKLQAGSTESVCFVIIVVCVVSTLCPTQHNNIRKHLDVRPMRIHYPLVWNS